MFICAKDQKDIFGILYNTTTGVVSSSEKALSTICKKADTGAVLNPDDVEKMDQACFEFLSTMRRKDDEEEKESEDGEKLSWHYICLLFLICFYFFILFFNIILIYFLIICYLYLSISISTKSS